jgi:hypothetical protein
MDKNQQQLDALTDIRTMMERSSRFISLSGLSGVFAGIFALIGAGVAYRYLSITHPSMDYFEMVRSSNGIFNVRFYIFLFWDAFIVVSASLFFGILFTIRNSRKKGIKIWDATARRLLINLFIPLGAGGLFCIVLLHHNQLDLVAPATLIFYGLALLNASKYTFNDIRFLGITELVLGLLACLPGLISYSLLFWAIGFGLLHIFYGVIMYYKYEREDE